MKIYIKFLMVFCAVSMIVACNEKTDIEESGITYLPKISIIGPETVQLSCTDSGYDDPGITAEELGVPVDVTSTVVPKYFGDDGISSPDIFDLTYVAYNKDGIPGAVARTVTLPPCSGDLVTDLSGLYRCTVSRNGVTPDGYSDLDYIWIKKLDDNTYQLSDAMGGWYEFGRGLGTAYGSPGMKIIANDIAANDFSFPNTVVCNTFDGVVEMLDFDVDPATKTIVYSTYWEFGFTFVATLTQVEL